MLRQKKNSLGKRVCREETGAEVIQLVFCLPLVLALLAGCVQMLFQELSAATLAGEIEYAAEAVEPAELDACGDDAERCAYVKRVLVSKVATLKTLDTLDVSDVEVDYLDDAVDVSELNAADERNIIHDKHMGDYQLSEFSKAVSYATVRFKVTYEVSEFFPSPVGNPVLTRTVAREHVLDARAEVM